MKWVRRDKERLLEGWWLWVVVKAERKGRPKTAIGILAEKWIGFVFGFLVWVLG